MSIEERVMAGIKFLDKYEPLWDLVVNVDTLDMSHEFLCVLGQIFGGYAGAMDQYDWDRVIRAGLGFVNEAGEGATEFYAAANRLWRTEIERRDQARLLAKTNGGQNE